MLRGLFARLTERHDGGRALFGALVRISREPRWYLEGDVPDTIDGRFRVLATVLALAMVRLESGGKAARNESVALTERFVEAMDTEHRQLGIGDPTLGKTVRKLVGSLAKRVELWRGVIAGGDWALALRESLYRDIAPSADALQSSERRLRQLWSQLEAASDEAISQGAVG